MSRTLVIAEKPSVARDYARVLHCTQKGENCLFNDEYVVSWAVGHLVELVEPEGYDPKYKKWNRQDLPILPEEMKLRIIRGSGKQFQTLKKWMKDPEIGTVICGTDSGREGELIFRYIYQMAGCKKPFERLWVSSMTNEAITEGFRTLKDGHDYDSLYQSARCRSEADWLVGMNGSRAFSIHYNALLSIGRVQTPTLAMIVNRQKEIDAFVPQDYWEAQIQVSKEGQPPFTAKWYTEEPDPEKPDTMRRTTRIASEEEARRIADRCGKGQTAVVDRVETTARKQLPPLLYDLTELQRDGNRKFGYSASKVLNIAQDLYEKHKLITYPRTDSRYLSDDMKETVRKTLYALDIPEYHPYLMGIPGLKFTGRIIDNSKITDHHAIIPTPKKPDLERLSTDERRIYDLIAMRLISAFYPAYEYETTQVFLTVGEDRFLASGRHVIEPGFMALPANQSRSRKKTEEAELPRLEKGDILDVLASKVLASKTQPPAPFTEATLLSAMEYAGKYIEDDALREQMKKMSLGTPATRAATIERLLKVGYISRKGKTLLPTEKGTALIGILPKELTSPEMTAKWERALERIYQGTMDPRAFMESIRRYVRFIVGSADEAPKITSDAFEKDRAGRSGKGRKRSEGANLGTCPLCGKGHILRNSKAYYCSDWSRTKCGFTVWLGSLDRYGEILNDDLIREILQNGQAVRSVTMPETHEKGTATFYFNEKGMLEMKDLHREEAGS